MNNKKGYRRQRSLRKLYRSHGADLYKPCILQRYMKNTLACEWSRDERSLKGGNSKIRNVLKASPVTWEWMFWQCRLTNDLSNLLNHSFMKYLLSASLYTYDGVTFKQTHCKLKIHTTYITLYNSATANSRIPYICFHDLWLMWISQ